MCLIVAAVQPGSSWPLVLAANRDEFHERPTQPAHWWDEAPHVLGGRDLRAGGTWLALSADGALAAVTNYREPGAAQEAPESRGALPVRWLEEPDPAVFGTWLEGRRDTYAGFNFLGVPPCTGNALERPALHVHSNRWQPPRRHAEGILALSNGHPDAHWPKMERGTGKLADALGEWGKDLEEADLHRVVEVFADPTPAPREQLPETGVGVETEAVLSPMFILGERYGTRTTTVVAVHCTGRIRFLEQRFSPDGEVEGEVEHDFPIRMSPRNAAGTAGRRSRSHYRGRRRRSSRH